MITYKGCVFQCRTLWMINSGWFQEALLRCPTNPNPNFLFKPETFKVVGLLHPSSPLSGDEVDVVADSRVVLGPVLRRGVAAWTLRFGRIGVGQTAPTQQQADEERRAHQPRSQRVGHLIWEEGNCTNMNGREFWGRILDTLHFPHYTAQEQNKTFCEFLPQQFSYNTFCLWRFLQHKTGLILPRRLPIGQSKNKKVRAPLTSLSSVQSAAVSSVQRRRRCVCFAALLSLLTVLWTPDARSLTASHTPRFRSTFVKKNIQIVLNVLWSPITDVRA